MGGLDAGGGYAFAVREWERPVIYELNLEMADYRLQEAG